MGFDTTVITDNMVAYSMQHKGIDLFTSAADTIARDGHIANKIGTFQISILAKYFGIQYYVTGIPDKDKMYGKDIVIEGVYVPYLLNDYFKGEVKDFY